MPTFHSFAEFGRELEAFGRDLTVTEKRRITEDMAKRASTIATGAARADLGGDPAFSGWKNKAGDPMPLETRGIPQADGSALLAPTRMSAGLWTVAQSGRKGYREGDKRQSGTRTRKSDGVVVNKYRKVKRNTGPTAGKNTADDARRLMDRDPELRRIVERGVARVRRKHFD